MYPTVIILIVALQKSAIDRQATLELTKFKVRTNINVSGTARAHHHEGLERSIMVIGDTFDSAIQLRTASEKESIQFARHDEEMA